MAKEKSKIWVEFVRGAYSLLRKAANPFKALIEAIADLREEVSELNDRLADLENKSLKNPLK